MLVKPPKKNDQGFTLIEAMVTLSIAVILMTLVAPAFSNWIRNTEIRSAAESLRAALQNARTEAILRNANVKFRLLDSAGRMNWVISCVQPSSTCPEFIKNKNAAENSLIRVGVKTDQNSTSLDSPINSGNSIPAEVTFSAIGTAPKIANKTEISRIDITQLNNSNNLRMVLLIGIAGMIRLCNPGVVSTQPDAC